MKSFKNKISESQLIYKSTSSDLALKAWPMKKTMCSMYLYEDMPCTEIEIIICNTLNYNNGVLSSEELATILGFNVKDDFESTPKRYKDQAEISLFNELIKLVEKEELIQLQEGKIYLTTLGEYAVINSKKRIFYEAKCRYLENFNLVSSDGKFFQFRDALSTVTKILAKNKISYYTNLSQKYDINPQIFDNEKELVQALSLQLEEGTCIFSATLTSNDFVIESDGYNVSIHHDIDGDFVVVYSNDGEISEIASNLLNEEVNKRILSIKIEWGYYLRLINDPNKSLDYAALKPFEDIIEWDKIVTDSRFCWSDSALFKMLEKNIDANIWHDVSLLCPIENIENYITESFENWDWITLSRRLDGKFIVEHASSFPWDFDVVIRNDLVKKEDIEQLLLNPTLTSVIWSWKEIMPSLSNAFVIKHIDNVSFDLTLMTENSPETAKPLILKYPDKSWNWQYISNSYDLEYILKNISLLAKRIDMKTIILRAFGSEEYQALFYNSTSFRKELIDFASFQNYKFNANNLNIIWTDEIINFFEQIGLISWCNKIVGGFEKNPHIEWNKKFFSKYSGKIIDSDGFEFVSDRINDFSIVDENPDFKWNWNIISTKKEWIQNKDFVSKHLEHLNLDKSFELFSSETFCAIFNRPEIQCYLSNNPQKYTIATELATIQLVKGNFDFPWDWNILTIKNINTIKIERLGDKRWVDKWDWNYLSKNLDIEQISKYLDNYKDYWNWSILTERLDKSIILKSLSAYSKYFNWDVLIDCVFTKADLDIKNNLPYIATCISQKDMDVQKSLWGKITRVFSLNELYMLIHQTMQLSNRLIFQWDLLYVYNHEDFNIKTYNEYYAEDINWELLSNSESLKRLFNYDKNILSYEKWLEMVKSILEDKKYCWDFSALSRNEAINWTKDILRIRKKQWDWKYLSEHSRCFSENSKQKDLLIKNIKIFKDFLHFEILSTRTDITFDDSLLTKFCKEGWDWKAISASEKLSVSNDFIIDNQTLDWDWSALSQTQKLTINKDLLCHTKQQDWDWGLLSSNKSLKMSLADLLALEDSKWDWNIISERSDIEFDNKSLILTLDNPQITWNWQKLSSRLDLDFNEDLLLKIYQKPLDWDCISKKDSFEPSVNVLSKISSKNIDWNAISRNRLLSKEVLWTYRDKLNWHYVSQLDQFQKLGLDFYRKYQDYLDWSIITKLSAFSPSIENLSEFENKIDWNVLNEREDFKYTNKLLDRFPDKVDWKKASSSNNIVFSVDFINKHFSKWDWCTLFDNPLIVENAEKYEEIKNKCGIRFVERFQIKNPKVYHFAHLFNAVSIIRTRKILSRNKSNGLFENSAGSNVYRRNTAHHYARFYFRPQTPTQYYNEALGEDSKSSKEKYIFIGYNDLGNKQWNNCIECPTGKYLKARGLGLPKCPFPVFFEFDLQEILKNCHDKCYFSTGNMQKDNSRVVSVFDDPTKLNTYDLYSTIEDGVETYMAYSQQEFLVCDELDFSSLNDYRIICYDEEQASLLKQQLGNDPICDHITTDYNTTTGIDIFHRTNKTITIEESEDIIGFYTNYLDESAFVLECNDIDKIEIVDKQHIIDVSNKNIRAYPSISFKKTDTQVIVRFADLITNKTWTIYTNKQEYSDINQTCSIITKDLIKQFETETSKLKIKFTKDLFQKHMINSYHGIAHTTRVMWYSFLITKLQDCSVCKEMLQSIICASLIHDLGKQSDTEGEIHGENSAALYRDKVEKLFEKDASDILEAVKYHSIDDSKCPHNVRLNKIWQILKDADALDRSRLPGCGCNVLFLRNPLFKTEIGNKIISHAETLPALTEDCLWDNPVDDLINVLITII